MGKIRMSLKYFFKKGVFLHGKIRDFGGEKRGDVFYLEASEVTKFL